jgi:hypothetical protein
MDSFSALYGACIFADKLVQDDSASKPLEQVTYDDDDTHFIYAFTIDTIVHDQHPLLWLQLLSKCTLILRMYRPDCHISIHLRSLPSLPLLSSGFDSEYDYPNSLHFLVLYLSAC